MAARFPVSATSVSYQIKSAWSSKIYVIYWAAGADSVHRLRSGDTSTTVLTRSTSGATYDSTNGLITGTSTTYFSDSTSGGYGALKENDNWSAGASYYGDLYNGVTTKTGIGSVAPADIYDDGFKITFGPYAASGKVQTGGGSNIGGVTSDNTADYMCIGMRHNQSDPTNDLRAWLNGAEVTGFRVNVSPSSTNLIGDTGRPLYFGGVDTGTGNTRASFEAAWFAVGTLSDSDLDTITADPSVIIEASSGGSSSGAATYYYSQL